MEEPTRQAVVQFRAGPLAAPLSERANDGLSLGQVADRDLARYYALLADELRPMRDRLSEAEASLIVDAINGMPAAPHAYRYLWSQVADGIRLDKMGEQWGLSQEQADRLVLLLQSTSPGAVLAVMDAAERFRQRVSKDDLPTAEILREVGLVRGKE